jgi:hypothetical protein
MQRGHTRRTASACRPDSGRMSSQSTCGYRSSRDRLSASPQRVWLVPGAQACTSPPGRRTPSGSTHSLDAATAYLMPPLCTIGPLLGRDIRVDELPPRSTNVVRAAVSSRGEAGCQAAAGTAGGPRGSTCDTIAKPWALTCISAALSVPFARCVGGENPSPAQPSWPARQPPHGVFRDVRRHRM